MRGEIWWGYGMGKVLTHASGAVEEEGYSEFWGAELLGLESGAGFIESAKDMLVIACLTVVRAVTAFGAPVLSGHAVWDADVPAHQGLLQPGVSWHALQSVVGIAVLGTSAAIDTGLSGSVVILTILTRVGRVLDALVSSGVEGVAWEAG